MSKREVMMELENRTGAGLRDGGLGPALAVLIAAGALLAAAPPLIGVALTFARDVGGNCDPACLMGSLGAIFGAAGLPSAGHGAEAGWPGSRSEHTLPLGAPQEQRAHRPPKMHVDGLMRFYKVYQAAAEFIGGKEKVTSLCAGGSDQRHIGGQPVY